MKYSNSRILIYSILIMLCAFMYSCSSRVVLNDSCLSEPISHDIFNELLTKHVSASGDVNYSGFISDSVQFNRYFELLENNHPTKKWTENERLAYWINAYNAYTIQLIMRNYPVKSIKDLGGSIYQVNTAWDIEFINICGMEYNLNNLEHGKIRKQFNEPRIHFAVNCASVSCPKLLNEAFSPERLDEQLDRVTREFIRNSTKNNFSSTTTQLSKIFKWYSGDFKTKSTSVNDFINQYSEVKITDEMHVNYMDYDWNLNEQK